MQQAASSRFIAAASFTIQTLQLLLKTVTELQGLSFMVGEAECDTENIAVLSIGTGSTVRDLRRETLREGRWGWGLLEWILPNKGNLVTTVMDGDSEASQAVAQIFFRVCRLLCQ